MKIFSNESLTIFAMNGHLNTSPTHASEIKVRIVNADCNRFYRVTDGNEYLCRGDRLLHVTHLMQDIQVLCFEFPFNSQDRQDEYVKLESLLLFSKINHLSSTAIGFF